MRKKRNLYFYFFKVHPNLLCYMYLTCLPSLSKARIHWVIIRIFINYEFKVVNHILADRETFRATFEPLTQPPPFIFTLIFVNF